MSGDINQSAEFFAAYWGSELVGFSAVLAMPSGTIKNAYRGHRTVVLPDFQGLGIGVRLSDTVGQIQIDKGRRYYSKTTHPRMGAYRTGSPLWRGTCKNERNRSDAGCNTHNGLNNTYRFGVVAYSHEYIGLVN